MKISELKNILKKTGKDFSRSISNIWKSSNKPVLCIGVYESQFLSFRQYYQFHLEMDYSGKILAIKGEDKNKITKYKKLIGKRVDLNSVKYNTDIQVKNKPVGVESADIVGFINQKGVYESYTKKNISRIIFPKKYSSGKKMVDYGNYEVTERFLSFLKKYKKNLNQFYIHDDGITYYRLYFKINDVKVDLVLNQFFSYDLKISLDVPDKGVIRLFDEEIDQVEEIVQQIKENKLSSLNKVKMITRERHNSCKYTIVDDNQIQAKIKFNKLWSPISGEYQFVFDFNKKEVFCLGNKKSSVFIPKTIEKYQRILSNF